MFTSAALGCIDVCEKAVAPDVGVDDHAIKLALTDESSVCTCVSVCCTL